MSSPLPSPCYPSTGLSTRAPSRQPSTLSSTSSTQTVRGRRGSSTSQPTPTASIFARLTGRKAEVDNASPYEEMDAGPSDYWRRTPSPEGPLSPPPAEWKQMNRMVWNGDVEDGEADEWSPGLRTPPFPGDDEEEFEKRLEGLDGVKEYSVNDSPGLRSVAESFGDEEFGALQV
jgi:hypothetical protein